ncbi:MAG: hypothetical protein NT069_29240 [Planctomycetota bacterium]|nr:hypothetical protein [Planctomycetota bacterium]
MTPLTVLPERLTAEKVTLARAFGSSMLVETATALWHIDENRSHPGQFDLIPHKLNGRAPALRFSMEGERITWQVSDGDGPRSMPKPTRTVDRPAVPAVPPSSPIPNVAPPVTVPMSAGGSHSKPLDSSDEQFRNSPAISRPSEAPEKKTHREPTPAAGLPKIQNGEPRGAATGSDRPKGDSGNPPRKTAAELRKSPEWKRASRQERKRLKRLASPARSEGVRHDFAGTPSGAEDTG